jgi:hypothetical protein
MATKKRTKGIYRLGVDESGPFGRFAPLCEIHHVSHLATATQILRKGRIPSLLSAKSIANLTRWVTSTIAIRLR